MILGIDTSNYKTSAAVTDADRKILYERSEFLEVEQGERGLRQSVAFFKHSNVLPLFITEAFQTVDPSGIQAVAVSDRPRRIEGSYMPVFLAGSNAAAIIAASLGVPLYTFSHQEGHIEAVLAQEPEEGVPFLQFHLSGGTTECLVCRREGYHIESEVIGGTLDISIGQLIDRVGVRLGFPFPAGQFLDEIAGKADAPQGVRRIRCRDRKFNLSGIESEMMRRIDAMGASPESAGTLVPELFERIALLLYDAACQCAGSTGIDTVLMAGGVASSRTIRSRLAELCRKPGSPAILWGNPKYSGDNAVGISLLGGRALRMDRSGRYDQGGS
ncbi:MAG: hypothetical protein IJH77_04135 [Mogibacterium sp.]|nr:hypothetical protein [Mogibacterium sp.]